MGILRKISLIRDMMRITFSPSYAEKVGYAYWSKATKVTTDVSNYDFTFYYESIRDTIKPNEYDLILDYGCGDGSITAGFLKDGYRIIGSDLSDSLLTKARGKGITSYTHEEIFKREEKLDIIYITNAFFYVHPYRRKAFIQRIYDRLNEGGRFYIFAEPDYHKRHLSTNHRLLKALSAALPVYQVETAGFYNKLDETNKIALACGFKKVETSDSWANYRSDLVMYK